MKNRPAARTTAWTVNVHIEVEGTVGDELGSFVLRTTGFNSIRTLSARLRYFHALSGGLLSTLPLELRLRGKSTTLSHRAPIYYVDLTLRDGTPLAQAIATARVEWDELGLEAAMAVARHLDGQLAEIALEGLPALAVAGVASGVGHRLVAFMAQVLSQLSVQSSLDQQLGQLLEQAVLADEVFRLLVVSQQARQQFFGYVVFLGAHCAYGQAGLRRRWIVRLHKILHTLRNRRIAKKKGQPSCPFFC